MLEYSELDPAVASAQNPATGRLMYNWSNICMHYFSVDWLSRVSVQCSEARQMLGAARVTVACRATPATTHWLWRARAAGHECVCCQLHEPISQPISCCVLLLRALLVESALVRSAP